MGSRLKAINRLAKNSLARIKKAVLWNEYDRLVKKVAANLHFAENNDDNLKLSNNRTLRREIAKKLIHSCVWDSKRPMIIKNLIDVRYETKTNYYDATTSTSFDTYPATMEETKEIVWIKGFLLQLEANTPYRISGNNIITFDKPLMIVLSTSCKFRS